MSQKGLEKVRTGCITCRIRKIKCDETHPVCRRCTSTGRKCDGYTQPAPGSYSWQYLLSSSPRPAPTATPSADSSELRSLAFFHRVVAPGLSGPLDYTFWTQTISQIVYSEPATRHAVLAISSLYEEFSPRQLLLERDPYYDDRGFAIRHYNLAIKHLIAGYSRNPIQVDVVLLTCILFICIEFIRGDIQSATRHIKHGISLLQSSNSNPQTQLVSIFYNLSVLPYFFRQEIREFAYHEEPCAILPASWHLFDHISHAQASMDFILSRAVRLVFSTSSHRVGNMPRLQPFEEAMREKQCLERDLVWWRSRYLQYTGSETSLIQDPTLLILEARWHVVRIWTGTCLSPDEAVYDGYLDDFLRIVEIAGMIQANRTSPPDKQSKFAFSMGFCPLLHFVAIKCRYLRLRLMALRLLKTVPCQREALWDAATMFAVGMRIVEIEHGIDAISQLQDFSEDNLKLPMDCQRVRENTLEPIIDSKKLDNGTIIVRRRVCFVVQGPSGHNIDSHDWITINR